MGSTRSSLDSATVRLEGQVLPTPWHPLQGDLTPLDFLLWGNMMDFVYAEQIQGIQYRPFKAFRQ